MVDARPVSTYHSQDKKLKFESQIDQLGAEVQPQLQKLYDFTEHFHLSL